MQPSQTQTNAHVKTILFKVIAHQDVLGSQLMDQVHVQLLLHQSIAQHSQQKQHVIIKPPVLSKEQLVLHLQEHAQIIHQQLLVNVQINPHYVQTEHWLMDLTHVYLLLLHVLH